MIKIKKYKKKILLITLQHLIVFIIIRLFSFSRVLKMINCFRTSSRSEISGKEIVRLAAYYNKQFSESLFRTPSCLEGALMLTIILNRRGIPSEFCLGIAESGGNLTAHAWLRLNGEVLGAQFHVIEFVQVFSSFK